jgi:ATP-binding cassette subfamily C protein
MNTAPRTFRFALFVFTQTKGKAGFALLFLLLGNITESVSILLLIPLLAMMTPHAGDAEAAQVPLLGKLAHSGFQFELGPLLVGFVGLVMAQSIFARFRTIYTTGMMQAAVDKLRMSLFQNIGLARWSVIIKTRGSDLTHALTSEIDRVQAGIFSLLQLFQNIFVLIFYFIISVFVSLKMTLFAVTVGAVLFAGLYPVRRRASRYGNTLVESLQNRQQTISEFLSGIKMAKAFNVEPNYFKRLNQSLERVRNDILEYSRLGGIGGFVFQVSTTAAAALFIYIAVKHLQMPLSRLAVMLFLFMRIAPRFSSIQDSAHQLLAGIPAFESVWKLIGHFSEGRESELDDDCTIIPHLTTGICLDRVSFRFGADASEEVLHDISLDIPVGQITALIGPSGSGKSTIADLVLGLLEPSSGEVRVDGVKLDADNRRGWRTQIAYVPQDVFLLHDTVAANLGVATDNPSESDMWEALDAANAREFVARLPEGLATVVGDRGVRLSGGERQRIALARGLLRHPQLLILDEATSALDWENQKAIASSIKALRGQMTIITIAHRPSMIDFADCVTAIEDGCVVETGRYRDLQANPQSKLQRMLKGEYLDVQDENIGDCATS